MDTQDVLPFPEPEGDTWQVRMVRLPGWVGDDDPPYRPLIAIAASADTGLIGSSDLAPPAEAGPEMAQAAIESLAELVGNFPVAIEVDRPDFAEALADTGKARRFTVGCRDDLPLLAEPVRTLFREQARDEPFQAAIEVPGVTVEQLRGFAVGAATFIEAAPWRFLESSDVIEIGTPRPAPNVRFVSVMSATGELGLGFAERRDVLEGDHDPMDRIANDAVWSVTFDEPWEVPVREHDLWLDHGFPTGPHETIPAAVQYGPKRRIRRASPKMLAFFEGVFRAIAQTAEEEADSGAWSKTVSTSAGPLSLHMTLPDILDPPSETDSPPPFNPLRSGDALGKIQKLIDQKNFESEDELRAFLETEITGKELPATEPEGPEDEARELAYEAMDLAGRRGAVLAKKALKLDPESPIAHLALAIHTNDPTSAVEHYRTAVTLAEKALGPEVFADDVGSFWGLVETRPYMEARKGLADCLWAKGDRHEAVEHYADLIRLNPNYNQGVRDRLAPAYLTLGLIDQAEQLLEAFAEDPTGSFAFNRALLEFQQSGDADSSRHMLDQAIEANPHVPDILLGRSVMPAELPDGYSIGGPDEAIFYFLNADEAWGETPGALDWLESRIDG